MQPETVILVHGLWRSGRSFRRMARALEAQGWRSRIWDYSSQRYTIQQLARQFSAYLRGLPEHQQGRLYFVGHSLGGLVIRAALANEAPPNLGRVVQIGTPNNGVKLIRRLYRWQWLAYLYGKPVLELPEGAPWLQALPQPTGEWGVIAGEKRMDWVNPNAWLRYAFGETEAADGTVEVRNARLPGMRDFIVLPVGHTWLPQHPEVIRQTLAFLRTGQFEKTVAPISTRGHPPIQA